MHYMLSVLPLWMQEFIQEWSVFDMLCLIYIIKAKAIEGTAILSAFLYSSDPEEAMMLLAEMKNKNRSIDEHNQLNLGTVVISDKAHDDLFKKGVIFNFINHIIPDKLNGELKTKKINKPKLEYKLKKRNKSVDVKIDKNLIASDNKSANTQIKPLEPPKNIADDMCLSEKSFISQNFENYGGPFEKPKKIIDEK